MPPIAATTTKDSLGDLGARPSSIQLSLDEALRMAWRFALPSFGLSLIWVNIHFACHYMGGWKSFSAFGKTLGNEHAELILLLLLDALMFLIALLAITFMWAMLHPCSAFATAIGWKWVAEKVCSSINM